MYEKCKKFLGNPVVAVVLTIIVSLFFYWLANEKQEISYSVSNEEIIASRDSGSPELSFSWKGAPIEKELKRFKIAIWNSGDKYIDKTMFSLSDPLGIKIEEGDFEVLGENISSFSRDSLHIKTESATKDRIIHMFIDGDDGLERGDGFVVSVFYIGNIKPKVSLAGRVKGINKNFVEVQWSEIKSSIKSEKRVHIAITLLGIIVGSVLLIASNQMFLNNPPLKRFIYDFLAFALGLFFLILSISSISSLFKSVIYGLNWVF